MGLAYNPSIVAQNLQICLDWGNQKCYSGTGTTFKNVINSTVNDGYIKNSVFFNSGNGGYLQTNGNNNGQANNVGDRIDINTSQASRDRFSGTDNFSIFFWNYWINGAGKILSTGSAGANTANSDQCIWQMWIDSQQFYWWNSTGGGLNNITCPFGDSRIQNTWQFVGFTYSYNESNNNIIRTYVNGTQVGAGSTPTATHSFIDRSQTTSLQWALGGGYASSCLTSNSQNRFGPFLLYNKTLSPQEIQQNFNALRGRYGI
jgi:hypothetical protein